jgi:hypothetical protein
MVFDAGLTSWLRVVGSMPYDEIIRTPVLLGLDAEVIDGDVKFLIDVVFQRIQVRGPIGFGPWYVAATDAQITLRADKARIVNHNRGRYVDVKLTIENKRVKELKIKVEPKFEVSKNLTISAVNAEAGKKKIEGETLECTVRKSELASAVRGDSIVWVQSNTFRGKAIKDYFFGNLHLWVRCAWGKEQRRGSASLVALPEVFHANGKKFSKIESFIAGALLRVRPPLANEEGTVVDFTCSEK